MSDRTLYLLTAVDGEQRLIPVYEGEDRWVAGVRYVRLNMGRDAFLADIRPATAAEAEAFRQAGEWVPPGRVVGSRP